MRGKCSALDRIFCSLKLFADLQQPRVVEGEPDAEEPLRRVHTVRAHAPWTVQARYGRGLECGGYDSLAIQSGPKLRDIQSDLALY